MKTVLDTALENSWIEFRKAAVELQNTIDVLVGELKKMGLNISKEHSPIMVSTLMSAFRAGMAVGKEEAEARTEGSKK